MKLLKTTLFLLVIILTGCKEEKKSLTPKEVSTKVFNLLQNFDKKTLKDYEEEIISFKALKELAEDETIPLDEMVRNDFKATGTKDYEDAMARDFGGITADGSQYKIEWSKIKFVEFKEQIQEMGIGKALLCEIYFTSQDNRKFFIKAVGIFDGKGYRLIKIGDLRQTYQ